jgi:hypothetical protein
MSDSISDSDSVCTSQCDSEYDYIPGEYDYIPGYIFEVEGNDTSNKTNFASGTSKVDYEDYLYADEPLADEA